MVADVNLEYNLDPNLTLNLSTTTKMHRAWFWLSVAMLLLFVAGHDCTENHTRVFKMGLLTPWHPGYDFSGYTSASAVTIAMEKVHADPKLNANGRIKLRYV